MALDGSSEAAEVELSRVSSLPGWCRLSPCEQGGLAPTPLASAPAEQAELSGDGAHGRGSMQRLKCKHLWRHGDAVSWARVPKTDALLSHWAGSPHAAVPYGASMSKTPMLFFHSQERAVLCRAAVEPQKPQPPGQAGLGQQSYAQAAAVALHFSQSYSP